MIIFDPYFTPKRKTNSTWIRNLNVNRGITQVVLDGNSGEFSLMLGCTDACILSCVRLFLTLWSVARQAPLPMGILQARILEWVATPSSRGFSPRRDWNCISCVGRQILYYWATREAPEYNNPDKLQGTAITETTFPEHKWSNWKLVSKRWKFKYLDFGNLENFSKSRIKKVIKVI